MAGGRRVAAVVMASFMEAARRKMMPVQDVHDPYLFKAMDG